MKEEKTIGEKIRQAIKEAGLTQQKLADKIGTTNPVVNVWVTGKRNPTTSSLKKIAAATGKPYSFFVEEDLEFSSSLHVTPLTDKNTISLPILADVPAGLPDFSDKDVETFWDIPRWVFPGADFVVKCNGDSLEPKLHQGDYCVIRKTDDPIQGRAMIVKTEKGVCMKVINKRKDGAIELRSTNPKYKPFVPEELVIIGLIIGHWSRDDKENWSGIMEGK